MPRSPRTVYVDKPVFKKPDANDPIRYILNPQAQQEQAVPEEPRQFNKLSNMLSSPSGKLRETGWVAPEFQKGGAMEISPEEYLKLNEKDMHPELKREIGNIFGADHSPNQYMDIYKRIMENPNLDDEQIDRFQAFHTLLNPQGFQDPYAKDNE